jgi:hypothetical protein
MRTRHKIAYAALIVLVGFCLTSTAVLYFTNGWVRLVKPFFATVDLGRDAAKLDARFPFSTPADGEVREARLLAYLEVCRRTKAPAATYARWLQHHDIKRAFGQVMFSQEAPDLLRALMEELLPALRAEKMSLEEFLWIDRTMRAAGAGSPDPENTEELAESMRSFQKLADDPRTPAAERNRLEKQVEPIRRVLTARKARKANAALYARYADSIRALAPGERVMTILSALPQPRPGRVRVEIR